MKKNRIAAALVLVALLVGAGLLSIIADEEKKREEGVVDEDRVEVTFPRDDHRASKRRRPTRNAPLDTARPSDAKRPPRDPIESAMTPPGGADVVFVELNAIRHSPVAERIIRCREADAMRAFDRMKENLGIDPTEDIDRLALGANVVGLSGNFSSLQVPAELGEGTPVGETGRVFTAKNDEGGGDVYLARVGQDLVLTGASRADIEAAVLRAEGTGEAGEPLRFSGAPGELYGRFGPTLLGEVLRGVDDPLVARLRELVDDGVVRATVDDNVSLSVDVTAKDAQSGTDLAQAIGGAVSAARMNAISRGDTNLARMLEQARVVPHDDGRFDVDLAVPGDVILDSLGCGPDGTPRPPESPPAPPARPDEKPVIVDDAPADE